MYVFLVEVNEDIMLTDQGLASEKGSRSLFNLLQSLLYQVTSNKWSKWGNMLNIEI